MQTYSFIKVLSNLLYHTRFQGLDKSLFSVYNATMKKRWWEKFGTPETLYSGQPPVPGASGWKVWVETIGILIAVSLVILLLVSLD